MSKEYYRGRIRYCGFVFLYPKSQLTEGRMVVMKMKYEKPLVAVERYELSQAIAGCVIKIGANGTRSCIMTDDDTPPAMRSDANLGRFADSTCLPFNQVSIGECFDGICYHTQANATFPS